MGGRAWRYPPAELVKAGVSEGSVLRLRQHPAEGNPIRQQVRGGAQKACGGWEGRRGDGSCPVGIRNSSAGGTPHMEWDGRLLRASPSGFCCG